MRPIRRIGRWPRTALGLAVTGTFLAVVFQCAAARAQGLPALQITSPADGTVVHAGDTVTVVVTLAAGASFQYVALVGDPTIVPPDLVLASALFQFTFTVPPSVTDAGPYRMVALGVIGPDELNYSPGVTLDVEPAAPVSAVAVSRPSLTFVRSGEYLPLFVTGHFSDGSTMDITRSSQIAYTSSDTSVATVTSSGVVTAVGTGCGPGGACIGVAMINVQYGGKSVLVQVNTHALAADTTPPVATASVSPAANSAGWNNSSVTVTLSASDMGGGNPSGVEQITYSATGAQTIASTNVTGSSATFTIVNEGTTTISYFATDNAGNVEGGQTLTIKLDLTPPAVNCGTADTEWHATDVSISCTASDSLSGLALSGQASFTLSTSVAQGTETANAPTDSISVCDIAANCATAGPITGIMVDKKAPTITITTPASGNPNYLLHQAIPANYSCADGGSGVATCAGTVASGNDLNTASVGTENFAVNATDKVGNASNLSAGYSVTFNICVLYDQTKAVESNATIPIKFELCDASQVDVSSSAIAVNLTGIQQISTTTSGQIVTYPAATPDANFRYSSDLGPTGGYIMNLSTKGYAAGTYQLTFTVANDPTPHSLQFQVAE